MRKSQKEDKKRLQSIKQLAALMTDIKNEQGLNNFAVADIVEAATKLCMPGIRVRVAITPIAYTS